MSSPTPTPADQDQVQVQEQQLDVPVVDTAAPATDEQPQTATAPAPATNEPAQTATVAAATEELVQTAIVAPATEELAQDVTAPATDELAQTVAAPATDEPAQTTTLTPSTEQPAQNDGSGSDESSSDEFISMKRKPKSRMSRTSARISNDIERSRSSSVETTPTTPTADNASHGVNVGWDQGNPTQMYGQGDNQDQGQIPDFPDITPVKNRGYPGMYRVHKSLCIDKCRQVLEDKEASPEYKAWFIQQSMMFTDPSVADYARTIKGDLE